MTDAQSPHFGTLHFTSLHFLNSSENKLLNWLRHPVQKIAGVLVKEAGAGHQIPSPPPCTLRRSASAEEVSRACNELERLIYSKSRASSAYLKKAKLLRGLGCCSAGWCTEAALVEKPWGGRGEGVRRHLRRHHHLRRRATAMDLMAVARKSVGRATGRGGAATRAGGRRGRTGSTMRGGSGEKPMNVGNLLMEVREEKGRL